MDLILLALISLGSVVRVEAIEPTSTSWGTGTCVASTDVSLVITAQHVIREGKSFKINGQEAKVVGSDKVWDLAALITTQKLQTVRIGTKRPALGDSLRVCGFGSGDYKESTGKVIKYYNPGGKNPDDILSINCKARNGDSGGPIFDTRGTLAAVFFGSDRVGAHGSCNTRVRIFIENLKIDSRLKQQALSDPYLIYGKK